MSTKENFYSNECERAVIACLLKDSSLVKDVLNEVDSQDFYNSLNRVVFDILIEKYQKEPHSNYSDLVSMMSADELKRLAFFCLKSFYDPLVNNRNAKAYASIVHERSVLRSLNQDDDSSFNKVIKRTLDDVKKMDSYKNDEVKKDIDHLISIVKEMLV